MTAPTQETMRERLMAEVELVNERLEQLRDRIESGSAEFRATYGRRAEEVAERAEELARTTKEWMAVKVGTASAVEDLGDAVDAIEADLDVAEADDSNSFRAGLDRQLRLWRSRAEHLRVQEALAEMDIKDDLAEVAERLRAARSRALVELRHTGQDAKETVIDLRDGLETLLTDVRATVERAADALARHDD